MEQSLVRRLRVDALPVAALALPGLVLGTSLLTMLIMAAIGEHPMWRTEPLNMSEAAAIRDAATVFQLIQAGEDPGVRRPVRAGLLFGRATRLTPLEAAIAAERSEVAEVLISAGAVRRVPEWVAAWCLAARVEDAATRELLEAERPDMPANAVASCADIPTPW